MNTQIVYSIISSEQDYYLEQLIMSVHSLRMYNPAAYVIVVTDDSTANTLIGWRSYIKGIINHLQVIPVPSQYNPMQRSRFLKTNLRKFVKGNYLFIDTDTIICASLEEIDNIDADMALVADCNGNLLLDEQSVVDRCHIAGFDNMRDQPYFNSGVMLVRDTTVTHNLYKEWYIQWQHSLSKGVNLDQPSMNYVNTQLGKLITELPGIWNCQIFFKGWKYLPKAKIIHYAGGSKQKKLQELYTLVRNKGINDYRINILFKQPKTKLYSYLTDQLHNRRAMLLLYLYIYFNPIYNIIHKINKNI